MLTLSEERKTTQYVDISFSNLFFYTSVGLILFSFHLLPIQEPVKHRHAPFQGVGRTLASDLPNSDAPSATHSLNVAPLPSTGLVVDDSLPITSLQLRLADGTRMVSRFNHHHTVRDIRGFIDASRPSGARNYQLQTMGFPPKQLAELDQTIEQAGIANSVVIQKF